MDYVSVEEARDMRGLRLVLTVGTPGPWGISARAIFNARKVAFVPVRQEPMQPNEALVAWTGRRNAPVAVYDDEPAVDGWLEILVLAERLGSGPSLLPDDPVERALATGFSAEICGAGGLGWSRRLTMAAANPAITGDPVQTRIFEGYGMRSEAMAAAPRRVAGVLRGLSAQLRRQREAGRDYLVGDRLGACDIHWACFSQLVAPLAPEHCAMPDGLRALFAANSQEVQDALDPLLIAHRDMVWERHIGLPLDF